MKEIPILALAGNPNVGKSTIFNALTGLNQHTGNWTGKTVAKAEGSFSIHDQSYTLVDLPGTYSLFAHSAEEEIARDFICYENNKATIVVCDATCLERNLNLVLQTIEITDHVIVCVNLMDEAKKKKIKINLIKLEQLLGVPVVGAAARDPHTIDLLLSTVETIDDYPFSPLSIVYEENIEQHLLTLQSLLPPDTQPSSRYQALRLLDSPSNERLNAYIKTLDNCDTIFEEQKKIQASLNMEALEDQIIHTIVKKAEEIAAQVVTVSQEPHKERRIDKWLTNRVTGIPIMLLLLCVIFWITISLANYPSQLLSAALFALEDQLALFMSSLHIPTVLIDMLVHGMYRVLAWVVAVMLPPMAIFFPMFTLLEDLGYLPRIAFNLDHYFKKAKTCGKQALTMCMGLGCNAAGVTGCRIIDSPREQLIAIITNNFTPCNGRFPTLIALISMFFIGSQSGFMGTIYAALLLTGVILLGVLLTFVSSRLLSSTLLKGVPSSFILELPPYRKPQIGKVIVRSLLDRTLFVLGRAIAVAAPAGLIIWLLANIQVNGLSVLMHCAHFLDPLGHLIGLDGVILFAFILGFPANEIVVPIIIMTYMSTSSLIELSNPQLYTLLLNNGWTWVTALCTIVFCLLHWPCSTTCLTIKKETRSLKWTLCSFLLPTAFGFVICFVIATIARLFHLIP